MSAATSSDEKGRSLDTEFILRSLISMPARSKRRLMAFLDQNNFGNRRASGDKRMVCDPVRLTRLTVNHTDLLTQKSLQLLR